MWEAFFFSRGIGVTGLRWQSAIMHLSESFPLLYRASDLHRSWETDGRVVNM